MKTSKYRIIGMLVVWIGLLAMPSIPAEPKLILASSDSMVSMVDEDKEKECFLAAKESIFAREWNKSRDKLEKYLKAYPLGAFRDEALFWSAQCLERLSQQETDSEKILSTKMEALKKLNVLCTGYPRSLWLDDAQALKLEVAGVLTLTGRLKPDNALKDITCGLQKSQVKDKSELKLMGLNSLIDLKPKAAQHFLKQVIENEDEAYVRKAGVTLLGRYFKEEDLLRKIQKEDADKEVRKEASTWLKRIQMLKVPVYIHIMLFSTKVKNPSISHQVQEGQIAEFDLPSNRTGDVKKVKAAIKEYFNDENISLKYEQQDILGITYHFSSRFPISFLMGQPGFEWLWVPHEDRDLKSDLKGERDLDELRLPSLSRQFLMSKPEFFFQMNTLGLRPFNYGYAWGMGSPQIWRHYRVNGIEIRFPSESIEKSNTHIKGELILKDRKGKKEYKTDFTLDKTQDKLKAFRKGDKAVFVVLQFVGKNEPEEQGRKAKYSSQFSNVMGCTIYTNRSSFSMEEIRGQRGPIDFGSAKVEIPGKNGKWILDGRISADEAGRCFIGREAILYSADGKSIAKGKRIVVPADSPEKYKVEK